LIGFLTLNTARPSANQSEWRYFGDFSGFGS